MTFVCECGFRAELSAEKRQRLAASGGRVKCPKCGKINTPRIPNEMAIEPPQISSAHGNEIDDLLGLNSAEPSPPVAEREEVRVADTSVGTLEAGKWKQRLPLVLSSIALLMTVGLMVFGRDSDKSGLVKRIERQEKHIKELDELVLKFENVKSKGSMVAQDRAHFDALSADFIFCKTLGVGTSADDIRAVIGVNEKQTEFGILDANKKQRLSIVVFHDGGSFVRGIDVNGKVRSVVGVGKNEAGVLTLFDAEGNPKHLLVAE